MNFKILLIATVALVSVFNSTSAQAQVQSKLMKLIQKGSTKGACNASPSSEYQKACNNASRSAKSIIEVSCGEAGFEVISERDAINSYLRTGKNTCTTYCTVTIKYKCWNDPSGL